MANTEVQFYPQLKPIRIYGVDNDPSRYMTLDAAIEEAHEMSATITEHPVEKLAAISDHTIVMPRRFNLTGRISETPFATSDSDVLPAAGGRSQAAWRIFQGLVMNRSLLTIDTNLVLYSNLLLESIKAKQDSKTSYVLDFDAVLREVFLVDIPSTTASAVQPATNLTQAQIEVNAGQLAALDQKIWATPDQFYSQTNIPDMRNVGVK